MRSVDLTQPIYHAMTIYPGDPEVTIQQVHFLASEGWNLCQLGLSTHTGTHLNVPYHMVEGGKTLDQYPIEAFMGPALLYVAGVSWNHTMGLIFAEQNLDWETAEKLTLDHPKFVGLSQEFEFDPQIERFLLQQGIISYENLVNTDLLPAHFYFYGMPLAISGGDGSPVRAFALCSD